MISRFEQIRAHFEKEAAVFDRMFLKVMPGYGEMMDELAESLPFPRNARIDIADIGCGTGNLSLRLLDMYRRARLTCVDMAGNMLMMARAKLKGRAASFRQADMRKFAYGRYDAVVSSLALHHIGRREKPAFYRRLRKAIRPGGVFYAVDVFVSPDSHLQGIFLGKWKEYMRRSGLPPRGVNEMIRRHQREDRPVSLADELSILAKAGFSRLEVVRKEYNFAVYGGRP